jgi:hypothetical protein
MKVRKPKGDFSAKKRLFHGFRLKFYYETQNCKQFNMINNEKYP